MKWIAALCGKSPAESEQAKSLPAPSEVQGAANAKPFPLTEHLYGHEGLPILDWQAAREWASQASIGCSLELLTACKRGWLLHLRDALGGGYELRESSCAFVLSPYTARGSSVMLEFIARTRQRIRNTLEGLTHREDGDRDSLIIFGDEDTYYRYVTHAYPEEGEFAFSSGMFLHAGCPHFVTTHSEIQTVERVIAHEMTHAAVSHLPIPLWLNEGLAVNTENRLAGAMPKVYTPAEMREKHLAFWTRDTIQEFWSGRSFSRPDDGHMLSYDLAQVLVEIMGGNWTRFRAFTTSADFCDGGAAAAREHLQISLGESLAAMFEQESSDGWEPDPKQWGGEAEQETG